MRQYWLVFVAFLSLAACATTAPPGPPRCSPQWIELQFADSFEVIDKASAETIEKLKIAAKDGPFSDLRLWNALRSLRDLLETFDSALLGPIDAISVECNRPNLRETAFLEYLNRLEMPKPVLDIVTQLYGLIDDQRSRVPRPL
ncbi:MAG TPA: hypothetical protein DCZ49_05680 [Hyphomonadaceae bacterium]|nr:hypothetical protein [Hyphomonadaceae bacterium]